MKRIPILASLGLGLSLYATQASASCGSAFCVLNTMWSTQGVPADPGTVRLDLRYEYVDQKELRSGRHRINAEDDPSDTLEQRTLNRNWLTTLDYTYSKNWSITGQLPVVNRSHSHIDDPTGAATEESWNFTKMGDARVLGTYRFDNEKNPLVSYGLTFGVKLSTGDYRVQNGDGALAERSLQPGTGSTDLVYGAFYSAAALTSESTWWVQALIQQAVVTKADFRPGNQYQLNLGYRQPLGSSLRGLLQVNTLVKSRDSGAEAEPDLSGSTTVFLSPGLSWSATSNFEVYGFFQLPVYRYVNGVQLSASRAYVVGVTTRF
jgi:hypothetical protein